MTALAAATAPLFLTAQPDSHEQLRVHALAIAEAVVGARRGERPFSGADPAALARTIAAIDPCPEEGVALGELLAQVRDDVLAHGVDVSDPRCAAHLHCPTLLSAAAAELAIGATNQSLDSFDQAPAATLVEDHLVRWLAGLLGLPAAASGVLTSGGTASNLLGLLLARERACARVDRSPRRRRAAARRARAGGSSPRRRRTTACAAPPPCSGSAPTASSASPPTPAARSTWRRSTRCSRRSAAAGLEPIALVATAGTTDLGAIDPIAALAERAAACGAWLHVDAAVGVGVRALAAAAPAAGRHRAGRLGHRRPAQAVVHADRRERAARARRRAAGRRPSPQRLPQPRRGRGRRRAQPRRPLAGHLAPLRRAEDPRRAAQHRPATAGRDDRGARRPRRDAPASSSTRTASSSCSPIPRRSWSSFAGAASSARPAAPTAIAWTPSTSPPSARCCAPGARSSGARGWTGASR